MGSQKGGFRYRRADGAKPSASDLARIAALVIPPAWQDVRIAPTARERVQAIGRDRRGRLQYRYHAAQVVRRERLKLARILRFAAVLPRIRRQVDRDLRRAGLGRERVMAVIVRVLGACMLRPGSAAYAHGNGSFGVATLRPRHVHVRGATIVFHFRGKSRKEQHHEMRDARVADVVRQLIALRRRELFAFERPGSALGVRRGLRRFIDVRRRDINAYLADIAGERISAKDFRTWTGTLACAAALANAGRPTTASARDRKRAVADALRQTADILGNTPSVCRQSYVFAAVLKAYRRGYTVPTSVASIASLGSADDRRLRRLEQAVLDLLRGTGPARTRPRNRAAGRRRRSR